ncbi:TPA: conjugal transfer protein TraI [Enterobacter roggenkampii]|nr:conjugal transfer protein TraI [Enterobacter roggenkampii]HAT7723095.1 conjugal transfer protein TraI [Enterobacter roggenkampii]
MKLNIKGERDKQLRYAFIGLSALTLLMGAGNVLTGSLAWYFATTQKTITTPLTFNRPFTSDSKGVDAPGLTQFAASFIYWRLNVTPENIDNNQKMILGFVPSDERDELKKALDIEAAQGASSDYVIALEGTEGGRKALASRCAFYISASRVKEHVQIYTDGKADWVKAVKTPERDIKTAHDALAPETQRKQAKAIWAMGQPVNKTAMGRAWVRHQGMQDASLTAKIIPATRRFPEPALALPVYDNNGRSAGLALVSLVASPEGRMTQGETRMVMTERARGAVLQRSQSGNTIVASDLAAALDAVRHHPKDGVVWQTGDEPPSAHLLKVSGGIVTEAASEHKLIRDQEETTRQTEKDMLNKAVKAEKEKSETQERIVVPVEDAVRITPGMLEVDDRNEPTIPAGKVLIQVASSDSVSHDEIGRHIRAEKEPLASKVASERAGVSRIVNELANTERDIIRQPENSERGRMPEREEQTLTRTIQKER